MTVFDIDLRLALPCVFVSHFLCALAAGCTSAATVLLGCVADRSLQTLHKYYANIKLFIQ